MDSCRCCSSNRRKNSKKKDRRTIKTFGEMEVDEDLQAQKSTATRRRRRIIHRNAGSNSKTVSVGNPAANQSIELPKEQIIDDDSLIRIFSFIPPIPFFFTTMPLINKQFYQYFFNFVTTCPKEELNYFREMNFWDFGCHKSAPDTAEEVEMLRNHFRLIFGEKGNLFFNILQRRMQETTEILYVPFWGDISRKFKSPVLESFENLQTCVFPQEHTFGRWGYSVQEDDKLQSLDSQNKDIIKQTFIFIDWESTYESLLLDISKYRLENKIDNKVIERIVSLNFKEKNTSVDETRNPVFENTNFFFKKSAFETSREELQKAAISDKEFEEFAEFSGFRKDKMKFFKNPQEFSHFHFGPKSSHSKMLTILKNLRIDNTKPAPLIKNIMSRRGIADLYLPLLLENGFELKNVMGGEAWATFFKSDNFQVVFQKIVNIINGKKVQTPAGKNEIKDKECELVNESDLIPPKTLLDAFRRLWSNYPTGVNNVVFMIKSLGWDILGVRKLQNFFNSSSTNNEDSQKFLEYHRSLWKSSFTDENFGNFLLDAYGETRIFNLWNKMEQNLLLTCCQNQPLSYLLRYVIHFGENDICCEKGMLNTPHPDSGLMPLDYLIDSKPAIATAILKKKLIAREEMLDLEDLDDSKHARLLRTKYLWDGNSEKTVYVEKTIDYTRKLYPHQKMRCFWNLKPIERIEIPIEDGKKVKIVDENYYYSRFLQNGEYLFAKRYYAYLKEKNIPNLKPIEELQNQIEIPKTVQDLSNSRKILRNSCGKIVDTMKKLHSNAEFFTQNIQSLKKPAKRNSKSSKSTNFVIPTIDGNISLEKFLSQHQLGLEKQMTGVIEGCRKIFHNFQSAAKAFKNSILIGEDLESSKDQKEILRILMDRLILNDYHRENDFNNPKSVPKNEKLEKAKTIRILEFDPEAFAKVRPNSRTFMSHAISQFLDIQDFVRQIFKSFMPGLSGEMGEEDENDARNPQSSHRKKQKELVKKNMNRIAEAFLDLGTKLQRKTDFIQDSILKDTTSEKKEKLENFVKKFDELFENSIFKARNEEEMKKNGLITTKINEIDEMDDVHKRIEAILKIHASSEGDVGIFGRDDTDPMPRNRSAWDFARLDCSHNYKVNRKEIIELLINSQKNQVQILNNLRENYQKTDKILKELENLFKDEKIDEDVATIQKLRIFQLKIMKFCLEYNFYKYHHGYHYSDQLLQIAFPFFTSNADILDQTVQISMENDNPQKNTIEKPESSNLSQNSDEISPYLESQSNFFEETDKIYQEIKQKFLLNSFIRDDKGFRARERMEESKIQEIVENFVNFKKSSSEPSKEMCPNDLKVAVCNRLGDVNDYLSLTNQSFFFTGMMRGVKHRPICVIVPSIQENDQKQDENTIRINNLFFKYLIFEKKVGKAQELLVKNPKIRFNPKEIEFLQSYYSYFEEKSFNYGGPKKKRLKTLVEMIENDDFARENLKDSIDEDEDSESEEDEDSESEDEKKKNKKKISKKRKRDDSESESEDEKKKKKVSRTRKRSDSESESESGSNSESESEDEKKKKKKKVSRKRDDSESESEEEEEKKPKKGKTVQKKSKPQNKKRKIAKK